MVVQLSGVLDRLFGGGFKWPSLHTPRVSHWGWLAGSSSIMSLVKGHIFTNPFKFHGKKHFWSCCCNLTF